MVAQEGWEKLPWMRIYKMTDDIPRRLDAVVNTEGEGTNYRLYGSSAVVLIFDGVPWLCGIGEGVPTFVSRLYAPLQCKYKKKECKVQYCTVTLVSMIVATC